MSEVRSFCDGLLIHNYPHCDLDGTPHPHCDHQQMTTDAVELAVIEGIGRAILAAGLPPLFARAGDTIKTTWGCERNKRLTMRSAVISKVAVGLYRDRQSMWYRPALQFCGVALGSDTSSPMFLTHIARSDGQVWQAPFRHWEGTWAPTQFRLEWLSPNHGRIERCRAIEAPGCRREEVGCGS